MKLAASNIEIKLTKAPVEFFYTSLQNWQLFEFIIASWDSIDLLKLLGKGVLYKWRMADRAMERDFT